MIITKKPKHVSIVTDDRPIPVEIKLTPHEWVQVCRQTPEARALKDLFTALQESITDLQAERSHHLPSTPKLVSALQEARVLVGRMEGTVHG